MENNLILNIVSDEALKQIENVKAATQKLNVAATEFESLTDLKVILADSPQ